MTQQQAVAGDQGLWTGPVLLELRNGRDWAAGHVEVEVGFDMLHVRYQGRSVAVIDRVELRAWFRHPQYPLFVIDDTRWTNHEGALYLTIGYSTFAVVPESLANLLALI